MASEETFGVRLAKKLRPALPRKYNIETKRSLLYAISFSDDGELQLGQNAAKEPTRGGGTGFEQDLLLFERAHAEAATAIIPRVSVELKFNGITTHDSIVYSEKARRIRTIYPFVRYGLILGGLNHVPARTLRLGLEFDFIVAMPIPVRRQTLDRVAHLLRRELRLSCQLTNILRGRDRVAAVHRRLGFVIEF